ncbi:MAG: DUF4411 family protein, partial [Conexivisphaerales archaeon]
MIKQERLFPKSLYCIDASALINLRSYPNDLFPAIWNKLESMVKRDELISPMEVYEEIKARDDSIYKWCKQNIKMFKDIDNCQTQKFSQIETKYDREYWRNQINNDKHWADPWVIALSICEHKDAIIVTDEKNSPNHIPYIAKAFKKQCINLLDFFRA